jgi:sugar/nucleoside kinase (ribokinase family)
MKFKKIRISGTGCALADFLYNNISFERAEFRKYLSEKTGDGGLSPGKLVFTEELEKFSDSRYDKILNDITAGKPSDGFNVGGPSLVSLIHVSQLLNERNCDIRFFGITGKDDTGNKIFSIVHKTPLNIENYMTSSGKASPFTDVFSDPVYDKGHGERTFVNNIGAAWDYRPEHLTTAFFESDIVCFGGTALVPQIHDNLTSILEKTKKNKCITIVNTVFDFRNEKNSPGSPWPLGETKKSLSLIDMLIMDREEAQKISGQNEIQDAADYFINSGVLAFIITNGSGDLYAWSNGSFFSKTSLLTFPVSAKVKEDLKLKPDLRGDTTGCGDNFAGGIIASIAMQLQNYSGREMDLTDAVSLGVASGGFSCYYLGGTYIEKYPGEKMNLISKLQREYIKQIEL